MRAPSLDSRRHLVLTWTIPAAPGGMTTAIFRRSRAFVRLAGRCVDVLTFDVIDDLDAVRARLRADGTLIDGVRLLNVWEYFRARDATDPGRTTARRSGSMRTRMADDGVTILQVDHFRPDGTLCISDRRDVRHPGHRGGRSIVLHDDAGRPMRSWARAWDFYAYWLDLVIGAEPAVAVVDSKTTARFALTYRRPNVAVVHVVHNSHLAGPDRPFAPLRASRASVLRRLEEFDGVVWLSDRQRRDAELLLGGSDRFATIPNSVELPESPGIRTERERRGIMLASLTPGKRIGHAVRAVAAAGGALDVYGEGPERARIQALIDELGVGDRVRLHGYRRDARQALQSASYVLLTSRSEGYPLVLLEAMAAGCVPIAYDVPYGPGDIVESGVNGFLVEPGSIDQLAGAIATLVEADPAAVKRMRERAVQTAQAHGDAAVLASWERALTGAVERSTRGHHELRLTADGAQVRVTRRKGVVVTADIRVLTDRTARSRVPSVTIALSDRARNIEIRAHASLRRRRTDVRAEGRGYRIVARIPSQRVAWVPDVDALSVSVEARVGNTVRRVTAPRVAARTLAARIRRYGSRMRRSLLNGPVLPRILRGDDEA